MAKKFIDAEECREEFMVAVYNILNDDEDNLRANQIIDTFDDLSAADVQEVRHGKWKPCGEMFYCSNCNDMIVPKYQANIFSYCPNCGARMDGEEND